MQGQPCSICGKTEKHMYVDHKLPLVEEYYSSGSIDMTKIHSPVSVQPICPTCSNQQGGRLSGFAKMKKKEHGFE
jgi:5-methylcytosine-specific restriction endonuclease McrA